MGCVCGRIDAGVTWLVSEAPRASAT